MVIRYSRSSADPLLTLLRHPTAQARSPHLRSGSRAGIGRGPGLEENKVRRDLEAHVNSVETTALHVKFAARRPHDNRG